MLKITGDAEKAALDIAPGRCLSHSRRYQGQAALLRESLRCMARQERKSGWTQLGVLRPLDAQSDRFNV